ncbi:MAG: HlyD family secretion protein [Bryobacteraceae bacterium]
MSAKWFFPIGTALAALLYIASPHFGISKDIPAEPARQAAPEAKPLAFDGVVIPDVTHRIEAPLLTLMAPIGSVVRKGQPIGESQSVVPREMIEAAALSRAEAAHENARRAQDKLEIAEAALEEARHLEFSGEDCLMAAEDRRIHRESALDDANRRFRIGALSALDRDRAIDARDDAVASETEAEHRTRANGDGIAARELDADRARRSYMRARQFERLAERDLSRARAGLGRSEVTAPASGILIALDEGAGRFGIAEDLTRLWARIRVPADEIDAVQAGQRGSVMVAGKPELRFSARVSSIAATPLAAPGGPAYEVTLAIDNPANLRCSPTRAKVLLRALAR